MGGVLKKGRLATRRYVEGLLGRRKGKGAEAITTYRVTSRLTGGLGYGLTEAAR